MHSPFPHFETVIKLFPPLISLTPFLGLMTVAIPVAESSLSSVGSQQISQSESCPLSEWACSRSGFGDHLEAYFEFRNDSVAPLVVDFFANFEFFSWFDRHKTGSDIRELNFFATKCCHRTWNFLLGRARARRTPFRWSFFDLRKPAHSTYAVLWNFLRSTFSFTKSNHLTFIDFDPFWPQGGATELSTILTVNLWL